MEEMFRVFQLDLRFLRGKQKRSGFLWRTTHAQKPAFQKGCWLCLMTVSSSTKAGPPRVHRWSWKITLYHFLDVVTSTGVCAWWQCHQAQRTKYLWGWILCFWATPQKRVDLWRMSVSSGTKPFWWRCHPAQNDFGKMPSGTKPFWGRCHPAQNDFGKMPSGTKPFWGRCHPAQNDFGKMPSGTKPFWGRCHPAQNDFGKMSSGTKRYPVWSPNQSGKDLTLISRLLACQVIALGFKPHGREEAAVRWEETSWKIHKGRFNKAAINTGRFNKASPHEAVQWVVDFQLHWEPLLLELFEFLITTTKTYKTYINDLFQPTSLIDKQPIVAS